MDLPEWVLFKFAIAETVYRCELKPNHLIALYWSHFGRTHDWIARNAFNDELALGTVKNLVSFTISRLKQTEEVEPPAQSLHLFKEAMFLVLFEMLFHDMNNVETWPPPLRMDWKYHLTQEPKLLTRFMLCYEYDPTDEDNLKKLI